MYIMVKNQLYWVDPSITDKDVDAQMISAITSLSLWNNNIMMTASEQYRDGDCRVGINVLMDGGGTCHQPTINRSSYPDEFKI